jgi:hypothetical protein
MQSRLGACQTSTSVLPIDLQERADIRLAEQQPLTDLEIVVMIPITIVTGFLGSGKTSKFDALQSIDIKANEP